jgi:hypothetical protein
MNKTLDISELLLYKGSVYSYDLETKKASCRRQKFNQYAKNKPSSGKLDHQSYVLTKIENSNDGRYKINTSNLYCKPKYLATHSSPLKINTRTPLVKIQQIADAFLSKIIFITDLQDLQERNKNISAIRLLIYHIADNPVGLRLLQRILNRLPTKRKIEFKIGGNEFIYSDGRITIPIILFNGTIARRSDSASYSPKLVDKHLVLSKHNRPFYIGLVHELIHFMHELEERRSGTQIKQSHADFGGEDLWGDSDDLHVIWGVHAIVDRNAEYDNVSELTFRIADNIPIRMFYERISRVFGYVATTLDKYIYENNDEEEGGDSEEENHHYLDVYWKREGINPVDKLSDILTHIGIDNKIMLSQ